MGNSRILWTSHQTSFFVLCLLAMSFFFFSFVFSFVFVFLFFPRAFVSYYQTIQLSKSRSDKRVISWLKLIMFFYIYKKREKCYTERMYNIIHIRMKATWTRRHHLYGTSDHDQSHIDKISHVVFHSRFCLDTTITSCLIFIFLSDGQLSFRLGNDERSQWQPLSIHE